MLKDKGIKVLKGTLLNQAQGKQESLSSLGELLIQLHYAHFVLSIKSL